MVARAALRLKLPPATGAQSAQASDITVYEQRKARRGTAAAGAAFVDPPIGSHLRGIKGAMNGPALAGCIREQGIVGLSNSRPAVQAFCLSFAASHTGASCNVNARRSPRTKTSRPSVASGAT